MERAPRIFISYRRNDTKWVAGRIYDRLVAVLGAESVFFDVSNIEPGRDFVLEIEEVVKNCDVLLAVIGKGWLSAVAEIAKGRPDTGRDLLRVEIRTALKRNIRVIPILVDGAAAPAEEELPEDLAPLARRNARQVSFETFQSDIDSFIRVLEKILAGPGAAPQTLAEAARGRNHESASAPLARELPFTVSVETVGGVASTLISRGSPLPAEGYETFSTAEDNQTAVEIKLLAGERKKANENVLVGTFQLSQLDAAPRMVPQILVRAVIDPSLVLVVTAEDMRSGRKEVLDAVDLRKIEIPSAVMNPEKPSFKRGSGF